MTLEEYLRANPTEAHKYGKHLIPGAHPECAVCTGDDAMRETMLERLGREALEVAENATTAERERLGAALRQEQAARDRALGLDQQKPAPRTFTREEVLTVLKAHKAVLDDRQTAAAELSALLTIFARME